MDTTSFELDLNEDNFRDTRIYRAIQMCNTQDVLEALYEGEDVSETDSCFKSTYLHQVAIEADQTTEDNYVPMVYQLSNAGINVNAKDYKEQTALQIAITKNLQELMIALLRVGCDPRDRRYKQLIQECAGPFEYEMMYWFERFEPGVWYAVVHNDFDALHRLVQSWCRISITVDTQHLIDLSRRANVRPDILTLLEDSDITTEFVHATLAGDELRMLDLLQDPRCDPAVMDMSFQENWSKPVMPRSLRETAAIMGHLHILHLLPKSYYRFDSYDEQYNEAMAAVGTIKQNYKLLPPKAVQENSGTNITKKPCTYCDNCQGHGAHGDVYPSKRPKRPPRSKDKLPQSNVYSQNWERLKAASSKHSSKTCTIL